MFISSGPIMSNALTRALRIAIVAFCLATVTSGCATSRADIARDQARAESIRADAAKARERQRTKTLSERLDRAPNWAIEPPRIDDTGVYASGIGEDGTLHLAMAKARIRAEFEFAKQYGQEVSGEERAYASDDNGSRYTALIDKIIDAVPVVGFETVATEVQAREGKYNAYVLLKLPHDEFNRVLKQTRQRERDAAIRAEFDRLEQRLQARNQPSLAADTQVRPAPEAGVAADPAE